LPKVGGACNPIFISEKKITTKGWLVGSFWKGLLNGFPKTCDMPPSFLATEKFSAGVK